MLILPKYSSVFFVFFIFSSFISAFLGIGFYNSFINSLYLLSEFVVFVCFYNYRVHIKKKLSVIIFCIPILFSIYSLVLNLHILNLFIPYNGYQFVYEKLGHNHLGDFLVLPTVFIIFRLYYKQMRKIFLPFLALFLLIIFISHSRSAYLTILFSTFLIHTSYFHHKKASIYKTLSRTLILILVLLTFFLVTGASNQSAKLQVFPINIATYNQAHNDQKTLLGYRPAYYKQSLNSIMAHPILGIGSNNFEKTSLRYALNKNLEVTKSAHNIFLEVMVGQGILGIIPFLGFLLFIILRSKRNELFFIFLAMLMNFQTDYTYQIYSFFTLFIVFCAILVYDKELKLYFVNEKK